MPRTNVQRAAGRSTPSGIAQRLVVEVDGHTLPPARAAKFERDRRKDGQLMLAGYRVLRITWRG